ncbi:ABC transporter permease [Arthrobacter sp. AK01]|uniref:ABC transporter permease n=1 Tax=Arthrobacter sp. AK01 TaxID=2894084 RepID=UPI001E49BBBC|nr:ABC transporter permease [Arthrobacter sp. AK01]MCD4851588.1 ABC transporter permease [Arthrobacter sp. AK01]
MKVIFAIAGVEVRRFLRDRSNIFFVFIFPLLLILLLGTQFGSSNSETRVALGGGSGTVLESSISEQLEADGMQVESGTAQVVREQLGRGRADVGVIISPEAAAAFNDGRVADLEILTASQASAQAALQEVKGSLMAISVRHSQRAALEQTGLPAEAAASALAQAKEAVQAPRVDIVDTDNTSQEFRGLGVFDLGAVQQLLLFIFLSSLTGAATLIQARRFGVIPRTMAAPVTSGQTIIGQAAGRFGIASVQGAYILVGTALLFGVDWGNLWLTALVLLAFSAVAAAAAMIIGSLLDHDGAATGIGIGAGLVLAGLGGCMVPPEFFAEPLQSISWLTPHRWAYDALAAIQRRDASFSDILPGLGVLAGMAAALLFCGAWLLRRSLRRAL